MCIYIRGDCVVTGYGVVPDGVLPEGVLPEGVLPGVLPEGVLPEGVLPEGVLPDGVLPEGVVSEPLPTLHVIIAGLPPGTGAAATERSMHEELMQWSCHPYIRGATTSPDNLGRNCIKMTKEGARWI